ncbi:hypothetical protein CEXT_198951 [Caerostris extrusa]|uniref:Uncharacterized protein n=1 Tax=Caerostris extrusa TaxID=172846 RepID=A0AAV4WUE9_CAEEX|nr:hypothetical protein CEXT_198951 [Caerostris extrusa]
MKFESSGFLSVSQAKNEFVCSIEDTVARVANQDGRTDFSNKLQRTSLATTRQESTLRYASSSNYPSLRIDPPFPAKCFVVTLRSFCSCEGHLFKSSSLFL